MIAPPDSKKLIRILAQVLWRGWERLKNLAPLNARIIETWLQNDYKIKPNWLQFFPDFYQDLFGQALIVTPVMMSG